MSDVFKEHFRELPAFKVMVDFLANVDPTISLEEMAARIMVLSENGLNWDTLCKNCGVLMDDNYEQYIKIEQLNEHLEFLRRRVESLEEDLSYAEDEARELQREVNSYDRFDY